MIFSLFFFNDTATTEIYTLSLHDALPIFFRTIPGREGRVIGGFSMGGYGALKLALKHPELFRAAASHSGALEVASRSEEHTFELQSRQYLVCRLLLEKKKNDLTSNHRQIQ